MADCRPRVLGITWRKFKNEAEENQENEEANSPSSNDQDAMKTRATSGSSIGPNAPKKMRTLGRRLSQAVSSTGLGMIETLGSFRNKIRSSTRRRKRLFEIQSPYRTPLANIEETPPPASSQRRRSARLAQRCGAAAAGTEMYSPFCIDTPSTTTAQRTPAKIRMGTHTPKRFNFSSPGQLKQDLDTVEESLKQLNKLSEVLSAPRTPRSRIRTTPGGHKTTPAKRRPIFV